MNNSFPQAKTVILIHGLHQNQLIMMPLAKSFKENGFITHTFNYSSLLDNVETHSKKLNNWLNEILTEGEVFHIVAHSLGGLVTRDFLNRYPNWAKNGQVGRCVTLGTPHMGSTTADYVKRLFPPAVGKAYSGGLDGTIASLSDDIELGVVAGNKPHGLGQPILMYHNKTQEIDNDKQAHDGTVYIHETRLPNAKDHIILSVTHTGMLIDKEVARQAQYFISHGVFDKTEDNQEH